MGIITGTAMAIIVFAFSWALGSVLRDLGRWGYRRLRNR